MALRIFDIESRSIRNWVAKRGVHVSNVIEDNAFFGSNGAGCFFRIWPFHIVRFCSSRGIWKILSDISTTTVVQLPAAFLMLSNPFNDTFSEHCSCGDL